MEYLAIIIGGMFINNYIFSRFLGLCPFLGVSKQIETATGMGMAVIFVMTMASAVTWLIQNFILVPLHLEYMQTVAFILVIAALVQFVEMVIMKVSPVLYQALGIYLPLITTNCAVLGVALLNAMEGYGFLQAVLSGAANALGWTLAILLFAGIRERLAFVDIPPSMQGFPIALVSTGLMSIAFFGFQGLFRGILF
ncbi:MAG: H+/Na+-translocating ferredoxin:NAD+ oxidoreductase subunit [Bacillota bacterium]|nr:H+/Na+-translocating ferredoxin:NAD+ oxidoreductase subunit [Bacillota bacterium]